MCRAGGEGEGGGNFINLVMPDKIHGLFECSSFSQLQMSSEIFIIYKFAGNGLLSIALSAAKLVISQR